MAVEREYRQFLAGGLVSISSVAVGTAFGWPSSQAAFLSSSGPVNPIGRPITTSELSWVGSLVAIGALVAPFGAGFTADLIGRKYTLLSSAAFFILSYMLLGTAASLCQVLVARLLQGLGVGFVMTVQSMYSGEIASDGRRGALGSFMTLSIAIGMLFVNCVGPFFSYTATQWICLAVPIVFVATFSFMPETPHFYIAKGDHLAASKSLAFLRGKALTEVQDEMEKIRGDLEVSQYEKGRFSDLFLNTGNFKALTITMGLICFQQLSGLNAIIFYTTPIFAKTGSSLDPAVCTVLVSLVQVIASAVAVSVVDRAGRRLNLLISAAGMSLSMCLFGGYFYLDYIKADLQDLGWLPVTCLVTFMGFFCFGFGPIPWTILGELFPANVKAIAASVVTSTCWIVGFVVPKYFSDLEEAVGTHWTFGIFGAFCAGAFLFTRRLVFETKGMSLRAIQQKLNGSG